MTDKLKSNEQVLKNHIKLVKMPAENTLEECWTQTETDCLGQIEIVCDRHRLSVVEHFNAGFICFLYLKES